MKHTNKAFTPHLFGGRYARTNGAGFTLIELLIVIAIIGIIAAVAFVALDPLTRFQDARDSNRWTDASAILDAIKVNQVDGDGAYIASIAGMTDDLYYVIGTDASGCDLTCTAQSTQAACVDFAELVSEGHLAEVPRDPSTGTVANTDYYVRKTALGAITVGACDPEGGSTISVSR